MTNHSIPADAEDVFSWLHVSNFTYWAVVVVGAVSVPILFHTLALLFTRYRRSQYFAFLASIVVLDLVMVATIIFSVVSDYFPFLKGEIVCKSTAFIANVIASDANWLWVVMYTQRYVHVFYPMRRAKIAVLYRIFNDTWLLLAIISAYSIISQMWLFFTMTEVRIVLDEATNLTAKYCGPDTRLIDDDNFKYLEVVDFLATCALPLIATVLADISVIWRPLNSKRFTVVTSETMMSKSGHLSSDACNSFKIQSEESLRATHLRRQRIIRRCLLITTLQGLLNYPYYLLQIIAEFLSNSPNGRGNSVYYYADAILYLVYLSQFPIVALFVHWLHIDWNSHQTTYRPVNSRASNANSCS